MTMDETLHKADSLQVAPCELFGFNAGQVQKAQGQVYELKTLVSQRIFGNH